MKKYLLILTAVAAFGFSPACKPSTNSDTVFRFSGTLEMTEHGVGFPVPGRIAELYVDEGAEVKAGQLLAYLDRYPLAKREHDRLVGLLRGGGTNQQAVEQAEQNMYDQRALAPVSGTILTKVHETGETISASSPLVILGDRSELWVRIYVPEGLINRVRMDHAATVLFDGLPEGFPGKVRYISPQAEFTPRNVQTPEERVTQTFAVKVYLDQPPDFLRSGVPADVLLDLPAK